MAFHRFAAAGFQNDSRFREESRPDAVEAVVRVVVVQTASV